MTSEQAEKLRALFAQEHVAVLITQGDKWSSATLQAFAETDALELIFIAAAGAEKLANALARRDVTVFVDARARGKVETFQITRASIQGAAAEVVRDSEEWKSLEKIFLAKNPFEAPFFGNPKLRMLKVTPARVSYAGFDHHDTFRAEF